MNYLLERNMEMIRNNYRLLKLLVPINEALNVRGIDTDDNLIDNDGYKEFANNQSDDICFVNSNTLGIDIESEVLVVVRVKNHFNFTDNIINAFIEEVQKTQDYLEEKNKNLNTISILWIVPNIQTKIKIKRLSYKELKEGLKKRSKHFKIKNINSMFYIDSDVTEREIKLRNVRRFEMLEKPPLNTNIVFDKKIESNSLKGYVFTANLYEIVEVYNKVGDVLFKENLRLGIQDQMGVNEAIKETLRETPYYFWYRNNGITIIIEAPDPVLNRSSELVLKQAVNKEINFSVINGAQTITTAADFFYGDETARKSKNQLSTSDNSETYDYDDEEILNNAQKAEVLVRVIQIQNKSAKNEVSKISIALNRQKPIKQEDIAFTNDFVRKFNEYTISNDIPIVLCRRGETSYSDKNYSLIEFARARMACAGKPGEARSWATSSLLKINEKDNHFSKNSIFASEWYKKDENDLDTVFKCNYSPIPFAIKLSRIYERCANTLKLNDYPDVESIVKNAKWYFSAFVVFVLNNGDLNYSGFEYDIELIDTKNISELIIDFAKLYKNVLEPYREEKYVEINSNIFKRSDTYEMLKAFSYKESDFYSKLKEIFDFED